MNVLAWSSKNEGKKMRDEFSFFVFLSSFFPFCLSLETESLYIVLAVCMSHYVTQGGLVDTPLPLRPVYWD